MQTINWLITFALLYSVQALPVHNDVVPEDSLTESLMASWDSHDSQQDTAATDVASDAHVTASHPLVFAQTQDTWYCAAKETANGSVDIKKKSYSLAEAQNELGSSTVDPPATQSSWIQAIIPMSGSEVTAPGGAGGVVTSLGGDPHTLALTWDGGNMNWSGSENWHQFNAQGWEQINAMRIACAAADPPPDVFFGSPCSGDDCSSTVDCPSGMTPSSCSVDIPRRGDGAYWTSSQSGGATCKARGGWDGKPVKAKLQCTPGTTSVEIVVSGNKYEEGTTLEAECAAGVALSCNCYSPWGQARCGYQTVFPPVSGIICSKAISPYSGGRRRGTGNGAGAKIFALCDNTGAEAASLFQAVQQKKAALKRAALEHKQAMRAFLLAMRN